MSFFESNGAWIFILCIAVIISLLWLILRLKKKKRYDVAKITLKDIDQMSGHDFEDYLQVLFTAIGYETYLTKKSRDYGADLLFINEQGNKIIVQAKRYQAKLGLTSVQEIFAAKSFYQADLALIITSAEGVTDSCWKLAGATDISFLMREELEEILKLCKQGKMEKAREIVDHPVMPEQTKQTGMLESVKVTRNRIEAGEYFYKK
ncbi:restriction endonuclease [Alkalicoccobacillus plakortidis]|uniref:Restriction endonuclease n=1 Tax=Alkalicoccobacillus plakortidis TaxID=444060 RepID=A0ABT0XHI2_9BACI|nr:restriction endonuclease [Alkalicoccobacillus plakortidis]MCM2675380.1 restriction endonuclease [Alkalicoccobacillus plakortidis]